MRFLLKSQVLVSLFCVIVFAMTEFFGSRYLGPLSFRNYIIILCIFFLYHYKLKPKNDILKSFRYLIHYYLFVMILGLFNGLYLDKFGIDLIFARFVPMIIVFFFITSSLINHKTKIFFIYGILFILVIDAIATILQGTGNMLGWVIKSYFSTNDINEFSSDAETSIGYSFTSGITGSVVGNGYLLASLGLLYWVPFKEEKNKLSFLVSLFLWLLYLIALFYNQQRMAFYVYLLFSSIIPFISFRSKIKYVLIAIVLSLTLLFNPDRIVSEQFELGRLSDVTNEDISLRHERHDNYYQDFFPNHFVTGDRHEFVAKYGFTPHNMFIETILLGGLFGLLIYLMFILSFAKRIMKLIKRKNINAFLFSLPVISVLLISWEHSSGYHTGLTIGAFCLALFELSIANPEQKK